MILDDAHKLIQTTLRQFSNDYLMPNSATWAEHAAFPTEAIQRLGKLGFLGLLVPEIWGGCQADHLSYAIAIEEIARGDASVATIVSVHNSVACLPILKFGSDTQKKAFLKPMAEGKLLGAFCLTEPQAGSDASNLQASATLEDNHYILNGTKQFITSGKHADIAIVFANTDKKSGKNGISCFIVPTNTPGYEVLRIEKKMGQSAAETAQISLNHVKIPIDYLLGQPGMGYKIALSQLECGRIGIAAQALGIAKAALEKSFSYALERQSFGKPLYEHQTIQFRLSEMATQLKAAQQLTWHAAICADNHQHALLHAAMAKRFATEVGEHICREAIQILGGYGYLSEYGVERLYRDIRACAIYEGTNEIQNLIIARELQKTGILTD
jgi:butyryl-CoA dehydrogenase